MIVIEDNDSPVIVAGKIIHGTKLYDPSPLMKKVVGAITGNEEDAKEVDMYDLEEIKELADYLLVYYNSHEKGD